MLAGYKFVWIIFLLLVFSTANGQHYQAIHGSSFAGSLGVANNPASILAVPYKWDITPLAVQAKWSTNAIQTENFSLKDPGATTVNVANGQFPRHIDLSQDLHLLNARFRLSPVAAIAFGINLRSGINIKTGPMNWQDTISSVRQFMSANFSNSPMQASIRSSSWMGVYGSYAKKVMENEMGVLHAGVTVQVNRGVAAGYLTAKNAYIVPGQVHNQPGFLLSEGELEAAYSSNFDLPDMPGSNAANIKRFLKQTWSSLSMSLGAEYLLSSGETGYDLKLGLSLLDLGYNKYQYSVNSRTARFNAGANADSLIEASFDNIDGSPAAADSLGRLRGEVNTPTGFFKVFQPARIVINADKHITGHFYINAELSIPVTPILGRKAIYVNELNLLAITPRFETRALGLYLPLTYNTKSQLWVGAALKAGPLLLGVHNLSGIFAGDKIQNGGAYLALNMRPWRKKNSDEEGEETERRSGSKGKKANRFGCPANVN